MSSYSNGEHPQESGLSLRTRAFIALGVAFAAMGAASFGLIAIICNAVVYWLFLSKLQTLSTTMGWTIATLAFFIAPLVFALMGLLRSIERSVDNADWRAPDGAQIVFAITVNWRHISIAIVLNASLWILVWYLI